MKKRIFLIALLGCLTFSQALYIPVYAAAPDTETGENGHAGGGGGYTKGSAGHVHQHAGNLSYIGNVQVSDKKAGCYQDGSYSVGGEGTCSVSISMSLSSTSAGTWAGSCAHCGKNSGTYKYGNVTINHGSCGKGSSTEFWIVCGGCGYRTNGDSTSGYSHSYSTKVTRYGLNCGKTQASGKGAKSFRSTVGALTKGLKDPQTSNATGNGIFELTAINANVASGQENTSYINNIKMTDKVSPDEIILSYLQEANKTTVNWENPDSNGTEYEFKVQVYRVDYTAENGLVLEQDSEFM